MGISEKNNIEKMFKPDESLIRQHLKFICEGMDDYQDGCIEIAYGNASNVPCLAKSFCISNIEDAVKFSCEQNSDGRNVYVVGAVLDPNRESPEKRDTRSNDADFYATSVVWADIDSANSAEAIRSKYEKLPPSLIVVTGREPNIRTHLWWKLAEPIADADELREVLDGLAINMDGDPAVKNVTSLMRLGGTVNWQTEKKRRGGRKIEVTEIKVPSNATRRTMVDSLLLNYPAPKDTHVVNDPVVALSSVLGQRTGNNTLVGKLSLIEMKDDGREQYMHEMLCATIIHLAADLRRWPSLDEVFADAWPVYASKVLPRAGMTLDQEGRGQRVMRSKIKSKLGAFARGHIRGARTIEEIIQNNPPPSSDPTVKQNLTVQSNPTESPLSGFKLTDWIASTRYQGVAKPIAWLIEGLFPQGVPVLLAAMGGLGKSFVALDMGIKVASPKPLLNVAGNHLQALGHDVMDHGKVVFLTAEDSFDSIHRRINKLVSPDALVQTNENLIIIPMSSVDFSQLLVREGKNGLEMTEVFLEIKRQILEIENLKLICIDPLQAFVGADITSKPEAAQFMWTCFAKIASQSGATFLATHHMRKDGMSEIRTASDAREGIRGTTGLVDGARAAFVMWQAIESIGECIARQIDQPYEAHRFIQGAIVKANDEADHNVMSFYREENGFLRCLGMIDTEAAAKVTGHLTDHQDFILRAIRNCLADKGRLVTLGNNRGTVVAISYTDLKPTLDNMGYRKLIEKENDTAEDIANRTKSNTFSARNSLARKGYIGFEGSWIWSLKKDQEITIAEEVKDQVFEANRIDERFENEFR